MNKLDEAKINLKNTINRLEAAIDKKLVVTKNSPAAEVMGKLKLLQDEVNKLSHDVDDRNDEIKYLREQNSELQAQIGKEQNKAFELESKNRETAKKIDSVIYQVQSFLSKVTASGSN